MFLFRFLFLTHSNPNQNYHPERKSPAEERNPLRSHSSRNWTRSKPDEKDERPLPSGPGLLVFLSQLRSGSHNQPSFCVFLLFSLIFNIRCLFMQSYKQNNNNKSSKIRKSITEIRKEKKEELHRERGRGRETLTEHRERSAITFICDAVGFVWHSDDGIFGNLDNRYLRNQNLRFLLQLRPTSSLVQFIFLLAPQRDSRHTRFRLDKWEEFVSWSTALSAAFQRHRTAPSNRKLHTISSYNQNLRIFAANNGEWRLRRATRTRHKIWRIAATS